LLWPPAARPDRAAWRGDAPEHETDMATAAAQATTAAGSLAEGDFRTMPLVPFRLWAADGRAMIALANRLLGAGGVGEAPERVDFGGAHSS